MMRWAVELSNKYDTIPQELRDIATQVERDGRTFWEYRDSFNAFKVARMLGVNVELYTPKEAVFIESNLFN